jgi:hypothetical protein
MPSAAAVTVQRPLTEEELASHYLFDMSNSKINYLTVMPFQSNSKGFNKEAQKQLNAAADIQELSQEHNLKDFFINAKDIFENPNTKIVRWGRCWGGYEPNDAYCKAGITNRLQYFLYSWTRFIKEMLAGCSSQQKTDFLADKSNLSLLADFVRDFTYFCALQLRSEPIHYLRPFYDMINEGFGKQLIVIDCSMAVDNSTCGRAVQQIEDTIYVFNTTSLYNNSINMKFITSKLSTGGKRRKTRKQKAKKRRTRSRKH